MVPIFRGEDRCDPESATTLMIGQAGGGGSHYSHSLPLAYTIARAVVMSVVIQRFRRKQEAAHTMRIVAKAKDLQ